MRTRDAFVGIATGLCFTAACGSLRPAPSEVNRLRASEPIYTRMVTGDDRAVATCVLLALRGTPSDGRRNNVEYLGEKTGHVRNIVMVEASADRTGLPRSPRPLVDVRFEEMAARTVKIETRSAAKPFDHGVRRVIDRCAWLEAAPAP